MRVDVDERWNPLPARHSRAPNGVAAQELAECGWNEMREEVDLHA
jgi:hypothetical protein